MLVGLLISCVLLVLLIYYMPYFRSSYAGVVVCRNDFIWEVCDLFYVLIKSLLI